MYHISVKSIDFDTGTVVMHDNGLVLDRFSLKYLGVKGHNICNLLSRGSDNTRNSQRDKR